jgi:hypothetical protein
MCTIASGVSLTRVLGQEHFPSDVLIGAVTGWMNRALRIRETSGKAHFEV